jgi:hypothetical protein
MPTKMAWLSFSRRNQILTLRTKLRNAAIIKKYLLLNFMFFLGGLGFKLHERFLICESVSENAFSTLVQASDAGHAKNECRLSSEPQPLF